jgi:hypothetical protein
MRLRGEDLERMMTGNPEHTGERREGRNLPVINLPMGVVTLASHNKQSPGFGKRSHFSFGVPSSTCLLTESYILS